MTILEVQKAIRSRFTMAEAVEIEKAIEHCCGIVKADKSMWLP